MKENTTIVITEIGSRLMNAKNSSKEVRDYCDIQKEIRLVKKLVDKMPESTVYFIRLKYIDLLEERLKLLKEDSKVKEYISICEEFSSITSAASESMKKLKKQNPELHSWIMLNKKRSIYERLIEEDPNRYEANYKMLEAVKMTISDFRSQHKESVDEWERLYHIKHLIRTYSE